MRTRFGASLGRVIRQTALRPMESLLLFAEELERRDGEAAQALLGVERLQAEVEELHLEAEQVASRATALAGSVRDVPAPAPGIEGTLEWASRARGALLLEHSGLVTERDTVVREASELLASVLGDPLTAIAVAG